MEFFGVALGLLGLFGIAILSVAAMIVHIFYKRTTEDPISKVFLGCLWMPFLCLLLVIINGLFLHDLFNKPDVDGPVGMFLP